MGKVKKITKSRKECRCSKCRKVIPAGSSYLKGEINFHLPIVRCIACGLKGWEVTTSDYLLHVGAIVYEWSKTYTADSSGIEDIILDLEEIRENLQDNLDNMPEGLQQGDTGEMLQSRIDSLEFAVSELEDIEEDELVEEVISDNSDEDNDYIQEWNDIPDELESQYEEFLQQKYVEYIDAALENIEM